MSIFDIDYTTAAGTALYPTNKRNPIMLGKEYSLLGPLNFIQTLMGFLMNGASPTLSNYNGSTVYAFGNMVIYQRKVYFRNEITAGYAAGEVPTTEYWTVVLNDFIGANEKVYFGPGKLVMEYALNAIFQTTFRQPSLPPAPPVYSDIYIVNNVTNQFQFYVGVDDNSSSYIVKNDTEATAWITSSDAALGYNFTVMVPNAVLSAVTAGSITSVVNRYKLTGYTFNVQGY